MSEKQLVFLKTISGREILINIQNITAVEPMVVTKGCTVFMTDGTSRDLDGQSWNTLKDISEIDFIQARAYHATSQDRNL